MRRSFFLSAVLLLAGCPTTVANDTGPTPSDAGNDANNAPTVDGGHDGGPIVTVDGGHDTGPTTTDANVDANTAPTTCTMASVTGCTALEDHTGGAPVTVTIPAGTFAYSPNCIRVSVGTMVTLPGQPSHPLQNSTCSPADSPIPTTASTAGGTYTFAHAGTYGYECMFHASSANMRGIIVVE